MAQAKRLHELDKEGKLNGDVIDGILSEEKKEDRGVIISTAELSKMCIRDSPCKVCLQLHVPHKGKQRTKPGNEFLCAALHIGSDIFAVRCV